MGNMDIKDEASIINSDENVVSDVEQADLSINGDDSYTIYPNAEVRVEKAQYEYYAFAYTLPEAERINN